MKTLLTVASQFVVFLGLSVHSVGMAGDFTWLDSFGAPPGDPQRVGPPNPNSLENPWHIDVSRAGKVGLVYVSDTAAGKVRVFGTDGRPYPTLSIGRSGMQLGQFDPGPKGIAVDGDGFVYVGDKGRLQVFSPARFNGSRPAGPGSHVFQEWTDGLRAHGERRPAAAGILGMTHKFIDLVDLDARTFNTAGGKKTSIVVGDWEQGWFYVYSATDKHGQRGLGRTWTQPWAAPNDCVEHGRYVKGGFVEFDRRPGWGLWPDERWDEFCVQKGLATVAFGPGALALWIGNPTLSIQDIFPSIRRCDHGEGLLDRYHGKRPIVAGPGGPLIYEHKTTWSNLAPWCVRHEGPWPQKIGRQKPIVEIDTGEVWDLDVDNRGNVYLVFTMKHKIEKYTSNGEFIGSWGTKGSGPGRFQYPTGISVDEATGDVFVLDRGNRRIHRFGVKGADHPPCHVVAPGNRNPDNCSVSDRDLNIQGDPGGMLPCRCVDGCVIACAQQ